MINDYKIGQDKKIVLVGCGENSKVIEKGLKNNGIYDYYLCDQRYDNNGNKLNYEGIKSYQGADYIIASTKYCIEIYELLKQNGIEESNIFTACDLYRQGFDYYGTELKMARNKFTYDREIVKLFVHINEGWFLSNLNIYVTEKCTLKCKACIEHATDYKCPQNLNVHDICNGIDTILSIGGHIGVLTLIGGEPFLNQSALEKILIRYKESKQIGIFIIITNGTIIPNDECIKTMKNISNIFVIFSNYGSLSWNQDKATKKLIDNGIMVAIEESEDISLENNTTWIDYGEYVKYNRNKMELQKYYESCLDRGCTSLKCNKLYLCPRVAQGVELGRLPKDINNLYIDLSENIDIKEKSKKCINYLFNEKYNEACDYCNKVANKLVARAEQI